jgi:hypothetical protein
LTLRWSRRATGPSRWGAPSRGRATPAWTNLALDSGALIALERNDQLVTSDPDDIAGIAAATGRHLEMVVR